MGTKYLIDGRSQYSWKHEIDEVYIHVVRVCLLLHAALTRIINMSHNLEEDDYFPVPLPYVYCNTFLYQCHSIYEFRFLSHMQGCISLSARKLNKDKCRNNLKTNNSKKRMCLLVHCKNCRNYKLIITHSDRKVTCSVKSKLG
jgi:ribosomal protein S27E